MLVLPDLQEASGNQCDTGSDRAVLEKEFDPKSGDESKGKRVPGVTLDWSRLTSDWNSKKGPYAPDPTSLAARAARVRKWLAEREESEIVVVSHGGKRMLHIFRYIHLINHQAFWKRWRVVMRLLDLIMPKSDLTTSNKPMMDMI